MTASHMAYFPFVSSPVARKRYTSPTTAMVRPWAGVLKVGWYGTVIVPSLSRWLVSGLRWFEVTHLPQVSGNGPSEQQGNQPQDGPCQSRLWAQLEGTGDSGGSPDPLERPG